MFSAAGSPNSPVPRSLDCGLGQRQVRRGFARGGRVELFTDQVSVLTIDTFGGCWVFTPSDSIFDASFAAMFLLAATSRSSWTAAATVTCGDGIGASWRQSLRFGPAGDRRAKGAAHRHGGEEALGLGGNGLARAAQRGFGEGPGGASAAAGNDDEFKVDSGRLCVGNWTYVSNLLHGKPQH